MDLQDLIPAIGFPVAFVLLIVFLNIQGKKSRKRKETQENQLANLIRTTPKTIAHVTRIEEDGVSDLGLGRIFAHANLYVTLGNGTQQVIKTAVHLTRVPRVGDTVELIFYPEKNTYIYADCPIYRVDTDLLKSSINHS